MTTVIDETKIKNLIAEMLQNTLGGEFSKQKQIEDKLSSIISFLTDNFPKAKDYFKKDADSAPTKEEAPDSIEKKHSENVSLKVEIDTQIRNESHFKHQEEVAPYLKTNPFVSDSKFPKIGYLTICSSVLTTGKDEEISAAPTGAKAALAGAAEDVEKMLKFLSSRGAHLIRQGKYEFSSQSVNSLSKEQFLSSIQAFFNSPVINANIINLLFWAWISKHRPFI